MSFEQKLLQINTLQEKIASYGKLPDGVLKKINYKFRLEWNYTSNSMEGNSLTKSETRSVMIGNITVQGKPIKDVLEVKGHDEVIATILKMGKGALNISEKRVKEIHTGIMHEESPEKKALVGQWKKEPNYLYNYKDERFDFVAPADVAERMHKLVNLANAEKEKIARNDKDALHPVALALRFNLEYITIHPFYDGNGRTSRILTNLILIAYGYPPLYIKENERSAYYQYLGDIQGYGGEPDVFYDYMAGLVIRSQELVLSAIEGKDIEEPDDIDKEIALWKKEAIATSAKLPRRNDNAIYELYTKSLKDLFTSYIEKHGTFADMFHTTQYKTLKNNIYVTDKNWLDEVMRDIITSKREPIELDTFHSIGQTIEFIEYKYNGQSSFDITRKLTIVLDPYKYQIALNGKVFMEKSYGEMLSHDECQYIVREAVKNTLKEIKEKTTNILPE